MGPRLQHHLKDAGLTALVAAALGFFIVGFRTYDIGKGLTFDYQEYGLAASVLVLFTVFIVLIVIALRRRSARSQP